MENPFDILRMQTIKGNQISALSLVPFAIHPATKNTAEGQAIQQAITYANGKAILKHGRLPQFNQNEFMGDDAPVSLDASSVSADDIQAFKDAGVDYKLDYSHGTTTPAATGPTSTAEKSSWVNDFTSAIGTAAGAVGNVLKSTPITISTKGGSFSTAAPAPITNVIQQPAKGVSSLLSNPMVLIAGGALVLILVMSMKKKGGTPNA